MPIISVFFGITIRMYFGDHPPPHIHASYQGQTALVEIATGRVIRGRIPRKAHQLVEEWLIRRKPAILENWEKAEALKPLERIAGLDDE